jgi:hypothetical protein
VATNHHPMPHAHWWYEHPSLGSCTNCADYCGHRNDSRLDLLPKRECKIPDFNRPNRGCRVDRRLSSLPHPYHLGGTCKQRLREGDSHCFPYIDLHRAIRLTKQPTETIIHRPVAGAERWPTSDRNRDRHRIGTSGRLQIGMHGRLRRNPQVVMSNKTEFCPAMGTTLHPSLVRRFN